MPRVRQKKKNIRRDVFALNARLSILKEWRDRLGTRALAVHPRSLGRFGLWRF